MSKRDTFERNIKAMTGSRSLRKAIEGWQTQHSVEHSAREPQVSCELCGTRFRSGAVIQNRTRSGKSLTITVGGTCLQTILRGKFSDPKIIATRRRITRQALADAYEGLIDPGAWITWIVENAPPKLSPLVIELKHLGMVGTERQLRKLIEFHDQNRLYAKAALLSDWKTIIRHVPKYLTLDDARKLLGKLDAEAVASEFAARGRRYVVERMPPDDPQWNKAWAELKPPYQHFVAALCKLSDMATEGEIDELPTLKSQLAPLGNQRPAFGWHPTAGLGLIEENSSTEDGMMEVYRWGGDDRGNYRSGFWRSIEPKSQQIIGRIEKQAFGSTPSWYKAERLETKFS